MKEKETPRQIETDSDVSLSVQTVTPFIDNGKIKTICGKRLCLLILQMFLHIPFLKRV